MKTNTFCFGAGRDDIKNQLQGKSISPGPGTYDPLKPLGVEAKKFQLKGKLEYGDPTFIA